MSASHHLNAAVRSAVYYAADRGRQLFAYAYPPCGTEETNIEFVEHEVEIQDVRQSPQPLRLEVEGASVLHHRSAVHSFYDEDELRRVGYSETAELVRSATGAAEVVVFDHNIRGRAGPAKALAVGDVKRPVFHIHTDFSDTSAQSSTGATNGGYQCLAPDCRAFARLSAGAMRCVLGRDGRPACGRSYLPESHGTDLLRGIQSCAPLVLCFGHAKRRGLVIQELRYRHRRKGPIYSAHRLCRSDASGGSSEGERRVPDVRIFLDAVCYPSREAHHPYVARIAVATGKRAARSAGSSPPIRPMPSAHRIPITPKDGVTAS